MPPKFPRPDDPVLRKYLDTKNIDNVIFDLYKQVCKDRPDDVLSYLIHKFASYSPLAAAVLQNPDSYTGSKAKATRFEQPLPPPMEVPSDETPIKKITPSVPFKPVVMEPTGSANSASIENFQLINTTDGPSVSSADHNFSIAPDYNLHLATPSEQGRGSPSNLTARQRRGRRAAIAAPAENREIDLPVLEKTPEETALILKALNSSALTETYSRDVKQALASVLKLIDCPMGTVLIKQGDPGDYFYIMKTGHCNIYKTENVPPETVSVPDNTLDPAECVQKLGPQVNEVLPGVGVGDLALLYGAPRAATVITTVESSFWAIHGTDFRIFIRMQREAEIQRYIGFLRHVEVLKQLRENELFALAQACTPEYYIDGQDIVTQGDEGNTFYFIEDGRVDVIVSDHKVAELSSNSYFGEAALLNNAPRNATCRSVGETKVAALDRESFDNLLGPLKSILERPKA
ncbi:CAMP-dependent protein kinase regulatory chain [Giardia duodenalis]|uniref:cAMP-dependent protein kinase regulatory chain n=1 Tax=Giardia intestinalis TaxID=5741 RepID=V6TGY4_GIAIN|nr:CAMP-dependent protein kinase regulatory chain [Giardia intestinalis]